MEEKLAEVKAHEGKETAKEHFENHVLKGKDKENFLNKQDAKGHKKSDSVGMKAEPIKEKAKAVKKDEKGQKVKVPMFSETPPLDMS